MEIKISSSLIKSFYHNGEKKNYCAAKVKACTIDRTHSEEKEVFDKGKFLEQKAGVGSAYDEEPVRLQRKALTAKQKKEFAEKGIPESEFKYLGEPTVDEIRLLSQAERFNAMLPKYGANLDNCQIKIQKEWHLSKQISSDFTIILTGTVDFISPFYDPSVDVDVFYEMANHDLKSTANIYNSDPKNTWSWAFPSAMDATQAKLYHYINGLPFIYWVYDYAPQMNYKIFRVDFNDNHMHTLNQDIGNTVREWANNEENGWRENATYENCKDCPLNYGCSKKVLTKPSILISPMH